jgi:hypothetical protein
VKTPPEYVQSVMVPPPMLEQDIVTPHLRVQSVLPTAQHGDGQSETGVGEGLGDGLGEGLGDGLGEGLGDGVGVGLPPHAPPAPEQVGSCWKYGRFDCEASDTQHSCGKLDEHVPTGVPS